MLGVLPDYTPPQKFAKSEKLKLDLPESFDAREQWK